MSKIVVVDVFIELSVLETFILDIFWTYSIFECSIRFFIFPSFILTSSCKIKRGCLVIVKYKFTWDNFCLHLFYSSFFIIKFSLFLRTYVHKLRRLKMFFIGLFFYSLYFLITFNLHNKKKNLRRYYVSFLYSGVNCNLSWDFKLWISFTTC